MILKSKNKNFTNIKKTISIRDIDINKVLAYNKVSFGKKGFKHFNGYKDAKSIRPFCIFLPKISAYRKNFDEAKYASFLMKNNELLKNIIKFGKRLKIL